MPDPLRFSGYAALFNVVDRAGDVFRRGAFAGTASVPLLAGHKGAAVGTVSATEDARGLKVAGRIDDPVLAAAVKSGALAGLSVAYRPRAARQGVWREITSVELVEISLVRVPTQPLARVETVGEGTVPEGEATPEVELRAASEPEANAIEPQSESEITGSEMLVGDADPAFAEPADPPP